MPVYHTAPLTAYDPPLQSLAADLFRRAAARIPAANCVPHTGSYSITGVHLPQTVAKIVIYQSTVGTGSAGASGPFPPLADGVHLFVRANAPAGPHIWVPDMQTVVFPQFFTAMSPTATLAVHPHPTERFGHFQAIPPTDPRLADAYGEQIAMLLEACHRLC